MRRLLLAPFLASLLLAACASEGERTSTAPPPEETATPAPEAERAAVPDTTTTYTGERFTFAYDDGAFEFYEVREALPPDYDRPVEVAKLVPAERAARLGEEACTYGERGVVETCTAEKENGLGVAVLPRPLETLRQELEASLVSSVEQGGRTWLRYAMGAEGHGADYYYHGLGDDATAVVFRSYGPTTGPTPAQLEALLDAFEARR